MRGGLSGMRPWLDSWNAYWFPETSALRLSVCRIIVVFAQLFLFLPPLDSQLSLVRPFKGFIEPQALIVAISAILPSEAFPTGSALLTIYWVTVASGITALIGLATRPSAFIFALGNWILVAHAYSYGEDHHPEAILCILLMLFAFSPSGRCLSVDSLIRRLGRRPRENSEGEWSEKIPTAMWPLKLTQVLLAFAYVSTGFAKVVFGGFQWVNGYTLQQYVLSSAVKRALPLGKWLAQQHGLCVWLSIGVILFEVFFILALIFPRSLPYFLVGGLLMHGGILLTEGSPFFQYIVLYAVFMDFDWLVPALRRRGSSSLSGELVPVLKLAPSRRNPGS